MQRKISENLHGVPLSMLLKHIGKTPQRQPENDQGVVGLTTPRAQTGLGDVLSRKES